MKKIFHVSGNKIKAGVAMLISDNIYFKTKAIRLRVQNTGNQDAHRND